MACSQQLPWNWHRVLVVVRQNENIDRTPARPQGCELERVVRDQALCRAHGEAQGSLRATAIT